MKNNTRPFVRIGAVIALACLSAVTNINAVGAPTIELFVSPGVPVESTNNITSQQNKMAWLDSGNLVGGRYATNPVAMEVHQTLKIGALMRSRSAGLPIWLAQNVNDGPDQWGSRMFLMLRIKNADEANINPRRVRVTTSSSATDSSLFSTNWLGSEAVTMSSTLPGRRYGPDGQRKTADDSVFDSGSSDLELNELLTCNLKIFLNVTNANDVAFTHNYWEGRKPMWLFVRVEVFGSQGELLAELVKAYSAQPMLTMRRGPNWETQYLDIECEYPPKAYQVMRKEELSYNLASWPKLEELLINGGTYTNDATSVVKSHAFFNCVEYTVTPSGIVASKGAKDAGGAQAPTGDLTFVVQNGNEGIPPRESNEE